MKSSEEIKKAVQIHDIRLLLIFTGLRTKLQADIENGNEELMEVSSYLIAGSGKNENCLWSEQIRYQPMGSQKPKDVTRFIALLKGETVRDY